MQWKVQESGCNRDQLLIIQEQGDNTPTNIIFPYDITGVDFEGTIDFSPAASPLALAVGTNITIEGVISFIGSILANTLTITNMTVGEVYIGMPIFGIGVLPLTFVTAFDTGLGGVGTYTLNQGQTVEATTFALGEISVQLSSSDTQDIPVGQYPFDLWSIGIESTPINTDPLTGYFVINPAITRIT